MGGSGKNRAILVHFSPYGRKISVDSVRTPEDLPPGLIRAFAGTLARIGASAADGWERFGSERIS
jgi:hypothetical protein